MKELYESLASRAIYHRKITFTDSVLELASSDPGLLDFMTDRLNSGGFNGTPENNVSIHCQVEYNSIAPDWPDALPSSPTRLVNQSEIGRAEIYQTGQEVAIVLDQGQRVLFHSGDGRMLCLVEPPPADQPPEEEQNLYSLANIILSEALALSGRLFVHAGAVGRDNRCQLWTGEGGAGKTTQVLSLVAQDWDFYGDDQVILGRGEDGLWRVWPFWRPPRVTLQTCQLLPELSVLPNDFKPGAKLGFNMEKIFGVKRPLPGVLEAINLLTDSGQAESRRLTGAEAFERVAPCFMHFLWAGSAGKVMEAVLELVSTLPVNLVPRTVLNASSPDK